MDATQVVLRRELRALYRSPGTYALLAGYQLISALLFCLILDSQRSVNLTTLFYNLGLIMLFVAPLLGGQAMNLEWRTGTAELLFASPVSNRSVVLGKYAALCTVLLIMTALGLQFPLLTGLFGNADWGAALCGLLGTFLLGATLLAMALFASSVTDSAAASGGLAFCLGLTGWFIGSLGRSLGLASTGAMNQMSLYSRVGPFARGVLDTGNAVFFLCAASVFLVLAATGTALRRAL